MWRHAIKDLHREQHLFSVRTVFAGIVAIVLMLLVLGRMFYLQIVEYQRYTTESLDNRVNVVAVAPTRGLIYDRNGVLLADNKPVYSLEVTPERVVDMEQTLTDLSELVTLRDVDIESFQKARKRKRSFQPLPLRSNLNDEEVARFAVNRYRFPGVDIVARLYRFYPGGGLAVHALGYVGSIDERDLRDKDFDALNYEATNHIGKSGVERFYENVLHGRVGHQSLEVNAQGRTLRKLDDSQPPVPGKDVILSLDAGLQALAERELAQHNGAIVAMDPRTGEILAMASMPTYDPNVFVNRISHQDYAALTNDPNKPLFNRAFTGQYPPGSTLKPFIALAGLEYKLTWPARTIFDPGYYLLPSEERRHRDWKRGGHGVVDLDLSITQSCDVYYYDLAYRMGIDRIHDFLAKFGLGQPMGLDAPGERGGLLPSREWKRSNRNMPWFPGETLNMGIGQGYMQVTPLQLASITSTLAMRGQRVQPRLLHALRDNVDGQTYPGQTIQLKPVTLRSEALWDIVIEAMTHVVHQKNGTAYWSVGRGLAYKAAGKTGTSQVFGLKDDEEYDASKIKKTLHDHSLFIAFAPVDDPKIAIAVIAENGGHGSQVAAPIARHLMDYYLLKDAAPQAVPTGGATHAR